MAVSERAVNVGVSATRLDTTNEGAVARTAFACYNNGSAIIYLGGPSVTTSSGVPVASATWGPAFDLWPADALYGIVASTTSELRVIESGL